MMPIRIAVVGADSAGIPLPKQACLRLHPFTTSSCQKHKRPASHAGGAERNAGLLPDSDQNTAWYNNTLHCAAMRNHSPAQLPLPQSLRVPCVTSPPPALPLLFSLAVAPLMPALLLLKGMFSSAGVLCQKRRAKGLAQGIPVQDQGVLRMHSDHPIRCLCLPQGSPFTQTYRKTDFPRSLLHSTSGPQWLPLLADLINSGGPFFCCSLNVYKVVASWGDVESPNNSSASGS